VPKTALPLRHAHHTGRRGTNRGPVRRGEVDTPVRAPLPPNRVEAIERELGADLGELDWIAEESPGDGFAARRVVATLAVLVLEQHGGLLLPAHHELRRQHLAGLGCRHADLPDVLVDDAELVARAEPGLDVDVPAEDADEVGSEAGRYARRDRVLTESPLDGAGDPFYLDEIRQILEAGRDPLVRLLGDQELPL